MKAYLKSLLFILLIAFTSCDKENVAVEDADLQGSWELRHVLGIQIAGMSPDFPHGNGHIVKFEDNIYQIYNKGQLVLNTTFRIENVAAEIDGTSYNSKIVYPENGHERSVFIKITGNSLKICSGTIAADGTTATYKKQ